MLTLTAAAEEFTIEDWHQTGPVTRRRGSARRDRPATPPIAHFAARRGRVPARAGQCGLGQVPLRRRLQPRPTALRGQPLPIRDPPRRLRVRGRIPVWRYTTADPRRGVGLAHSAPPCACPTPQHIEPCPALDPERLLTLYRQLRKAQEDAKNEPGAADFYYGEMETRLHAANTPAGKGSDRRSTGRYLDMAFALPAPCRRCSSCSPLPRQNSQLSASQLPRLSGTCPSATPTQAWLWPTSKQPCQDHVQAGSPPSTTAWTAPHRC